MTVPKSPVSSFGPELMALLLRGSLEEVVVELPSYTSAKHLQARLHHLRAAMTRENHPKLSTVQRARVSVLWGTKASYAETDDLRSPHGVHKPRNPSVPAKLYLRPQDLEYKTAIENAGVTLAKPASVPPSPPSVPSQTAADIAWIDKLIEGTE